MRWIGPVLAVIGLAAIAAAQLHPVADRSMLERGGVSVILSYQRALPLLGLSLVLALARPWLAALGAVLAALGLWFGFAAREWLIATIASGPAMASRLGLPGPISCLAAGLVLAAPERLRSWLLPPAAIVIGAMLAIGVKLVDPSFHDPNFLRGAVAASVWLVAAIGLTGQLCDRPWFRIATRILGSWLVAIGLMLGTAVLLPRPRIDAAPQPPERLEGPAFPGLERRPPDTRRPRSPFARPEFDPAAPTLTQGMET